MTDCIRIIPHEAVPLCGSFEVRFPDGRPSRYIAGRRLRPDLVDGATQNRRHDQLRVLSRACSIPSDQSIQARRIAQISRLLETRLDCWIDSMGPLA
jgi:hypothetical protein